MRNCVKTWRETRLQQGKVSRSAWAVVAADSWLPGFNLGLGISSSSMNFVIMCIAFPVALTVEVTAKEGLLLPNWAIFLSAESTWGCPLRET